MCRAHLPPKNHRAIVGSVLPRGWKMWNHTWPRNTSAKLKQSIFTFYVRNSTSCALVYARRKMTTDMGVSPFHYPPRFLAAFHTLAIPAFQGAHTRKLLYFFRARIPAVKLVGDYTMDGGRGRCGSFTAFYHPNDSLIMILM